MIQLINKFDFPEVVKFTTNIPDKDIDPHCKDAQNFDTITKTPVTKSGGVNMITDIENAINVSPVTRPELITLFNDFIKPYMVCSAYRRFQLGHGRNITQFGIRMNQEETSVEISDKARGELIQDTIGKVNVYLSRFMVALSEANLTFDGIVYEYRDCEKNKVKRRHRNIAI